MRIFSVCEGTGKYSLSANCFREVVVNCRFEDSPGRWTIKQLMHGLVAAAVDTSRQRTACNKVDAPLLFTMAVAVGLAAPYIGRIGVC